MRFLVAESCTRNPSIFERRKQNYFRDPHFEESILSLKNLRCGLVLGSKAVQVRAILKSQNAGAILRDTTAPQKILRIVKCASLKKCAH